MQSFDFSPTSNPQESVRLFALNDVEGCEEATATFEGPVLALHLGSKARVQQHRASRRYAATFHEGQLSLIPAECETSCSTKDRFSFLHLHWGKHFIARLGEREVPNVYLFEDSTCQTLLTSMARRARQQGIASRLYLESAAVVLAERMFELHPEVAISSRRGLPPELLARAEEYFRAHMGDNPGMTEVAGSVGLSVRHFNRLFKRTTGLPPHRYFDAIRLERARQLLTHKSARVLDVALEVGFANASHFAAFFQRASGYTPQEFRRICAPSAAVPVPGNEAVRPAGDR